jgi:hypothetical protein
VKPDARAWNAGWSLFVGGIVAYLTLSAQGLLMIGIPYDAEWGPMIAKLHPGTWMILAGFGLLLSSYGHPARVAGGLLWAQRSVAVYCACIALTFVYSVGRYGPSGAAFIIDTLMMPAICALCVRMASAGHRHTLLKIVIGIVAVNTVIGMAESMLQYRLIPLRLGGQPEIIEDYFRPSALLGHPLNNALITATVLPAVLYLRMSALRRGALMLLLWVGVLAFGGRTSFVLATIIYGGWFALKFALATVEGRFSYTQLTGTAVMAVFAGAVLAWGIVESGIGERIFNSLQWDSSASVRTRIWNVFLYLSDEDMLFGVAPRNLPLLLNSIGIQEHGESIENFWLGMYLQLGAVGFVPFAVAMASAFLWLWTSSGSELRLSTLLFFLTASTSNSLTSKTICLVIQFVLVALVRRTRIPEGADTTAAEPRPGLLRPVFPNHRSASRHPR